MKKTVLYFILVLFFIFSSCNNGNVIQIENDKQLEILNDLTKLNDAYKNFELNYLPDDISRCFKRVSGTSGIIGTWERKDRFVGQIETLIFAPDGTYSYCKKYNYYDLFIATEKNYEGFYNLYEYENAPLVDCNCIQFPEITHNIMIYEVNDQYLYIYIENLLGEDDDIY